MQGRYWTFFLFACAAIALRNPDWWVHPQFFAEDGTVFFAQQLVRGPQALLLPHNNYFHLIPRLLAWLSSAFPILWRPLLYQVAGIVIPALCAAYFILPECRFVIESDEMRMAVSTLALIGTHGQDLFANIAALQVFLLPVGILLLAGKRGGGLRAAAVGLITLTTPALVLFLPVAIWQWARYQTLVARIFLCCGAAQVGMILAAGLPGPHAAPSVWLPVAALESWVYRVIGTSFAGFDWSFFVGNQGGIAPALIILGAIAALLVWAQSQLRLPLRFWIVLALGPGMILEALLGRPELMKAFDNPGRFTLGGGDRYFYIPACLLFVAVAIVIERVAARWNQEQRAIALFFLFLAGIYENYPVQKYLDLHWANGAAQLDGWKADRNRRVMVSINPTEPDGWVIDVP